MGQCTGNVVIMCLAGDNICYVQRTSTVDVISKSSSGDLMSR